MARPLYTVSFLHRDGTWHVSRFFNTVKAARKWAKLICSAGYAQQVQIHKGPVGSELVDRWAA
jgi:hypothetical protein